MRENVSSTTVTPRRHERTRFTPSEVVSALQIIGAMSPIELLTAGYINIPAVNEAKAIADRAGYDAALRRLYESNLEPVNL